MISAASRGVDETRAPVRAPRRTPSVACWLSVWTPRCTLACVGQLEVADRLDDTTAASGWWRRCRDRPADARGSVVASTGKVPPDASDIERRSAPADAGNCGLAWRLTPRRCVEPRHHQGLQPTPERGVRDLLQHFRRKGVGQDLPPQRRTDAAALEVECRHRSRLPTVAPWVHFTSSAKISS